MILRSTFLTLLGLAVSVRADGLGFEPYIPVCELVVVSVCVRGEKSEE